MPRTVRRRPSAALVVALVALFASLTGSAVAAGTIIKSNSQVASNTITSRNVVAESLTGADIAESTLTTVPLGGYEIVRTEGASPAHSVKGGSASCPAGKKVLGGGALPLSPAPEDQLVLQSHPATDREWQADVQNVSETPSNFVVFAVCALAG